MATDQPGALFSTRKIVQQILTEHARTLGATLRYGHTVTELSQDDEGFTVVTDTTEGLVTLRGSYLVGCDGRRSIVRKNSGIDFVGTGPTTISRMGFATATATHTIRFGFHRMERGWLMRFPGNRWIVIEWDVPEDLSVSASLTRPGSQVSRCAIPDAYTFADDAHGLSRLRPDAPGHSGLDQCASMFAPCLLGRPGTPRHNPVSTARRGCGRSDRIAAPGTC